jgi:transcriptional regulator with AAA-type ATPase domain/transcriptional regulatory protein LevR
MKRIDKVEQALLEIGSGNKITASELAERLELSRANVSSDLNQLHLEGVAIKSGTKPVYYCLADTVRRETGKTEEDLEDDSDDDSDGFDDFLRNNDSLRQCGELAKAAVLYPPQGMHIMLFGETGVGKSMFAKMIFDYAVTRNRISNPGAFVVFNCADYANNPELLMSHLFGVIKGAYTGADHDQCGLLEHADGGILFLDEVHRLPPEGQEMLFMYIDRGMFRRLGETENIRTAHVMLICATTEVPESSLLRTFTRRIPMQIKIPNLDERSVEERLGLITTFFTGESERLENPIKVSVNSMRALLGYTCVNNVGQLKSDIQLLCALAYSDYISHKRDSISISSYVLPMNIRNGILVEKNRKKIWNILAGIPSRFVTFDGRHQLPAFNSKFAGGDIYDIIEQRTEEMRRVGADQEQIDDIIDNIMAGYYKQYGQQKETDRESGAEIRMGAEILTTTDKILSIASGELGYAFNTNIRYGLSLHLSNAIRRIQQGLPIINPQLRNIQAKWPELFKIAENALAMIQNDFNIKLPLDEAGFIALFFIPENYFIAKRYPVQVIVIAHGTGVATGLAKTANGFLGTDVIEGFDITQNENYDHCYQKIKGFLDEHKEINEVLLLVDMEFLINISYDLDRELGIANKCIPLVSSPHVLEAGSKVLLGYPLQDVYESVKTITLQTINERSPFAAKQEDEKLYIVTVCTTGEGGAKILKSYLERNLNLQNGLCEIVTIPITNKWELAERIEQLNINGRIIGVVSAFSTNIPVPHFPLSISMSPEGIKQIQQHIDTEKIFTQISWNMKEILGSIKDNGVIRNIRGMIERIGRAVEAEPDMEILIGVFCHICCMLDRLKQGGKIGDFPDIQGWMQKYPREITLIRQECDVLANAIGVAIPLDEVCYILTFFKKESLL